MRALGLPLAAAMLLGLPAALPAAEVSIGPNRAVLVDGEPFFPLFMWLQPTRLIDYHKDLGVNCLMGEGANDQSQGPAFLDALEAAGMYGIVHFSEANLPLADHPALLTWMFGDEPDLAGQTPFVPPTLDGATVVLEAESPQASTFPEGRSWLVKQHAQLSGGSWLHVTQDNLPEPAYTAIYELEAPEAGTYVLWDRGFMKQWGSPTRWRIDAGEWQTCPRDAKTIEGRKVGSNQSVGWHRYGEVDLATGGHTLEIAAGDGRTLGKPDQVGTDLLFGVDLFLLTTSQAEPSTPYITVPRTSAEAIAEQYAAKLAADPDRPLYLNLTCGFFEPYRKLPPEMYDAYCAATDLVGYDHYPIYGWGRPDKIHEIAQATAALRKIAGEGKPVWAILEVTNGGQWVRDDMRPPTPEEVRAEVWMAIVNGATGIGYFPHVWKPEYQQSRIPPENEEALRRINAEIAELAPVILGDPVEGVVCESEGELPVEVLAKQSPDGTYVFAVNLLRAERQARVVVPNLQTGARIEVLGENRALTAEEGAFEDSFGELGVHLYRVGD
ncbi:MAG: hypothetical protein FJX74_01240 [Armatimonadetes bacterium]|nr:hypothetical protein [Armatimonadota bacterium]